VLLPTLYRLILKIERVIHMSPTFPIKSPTQLYTSSNVGSGTSVDNSGQNSSRFSLSSFTLERGENITLTPLYEDGTAVHHICQTILDCIGND
jgi:hypothetical protein